MTKDIQIHTRTEIVETKFGKLEVYNPEEDIDYCAFRTAWGYITNITFGNVMTVLIPTARNDFFEERTLLKETLKKSHVSQAFKKYCTENKVVAKTDPHDQNRRYFPYDETVRFIKDFMESFREQILMKHKEATTKINGDAPDIDDSQT